MFHLARSLFVTLAALALVTPQVAAQDFSCGEWTVWRRFAELPLHFSWRLCSATPRLYELQWRWWNASDEPIEFTYKLYLRDPVRCEDDRGRTFLSAKHRLKAQEQEGEGQRRTRRIARDLYDGWLYWCVWITAQRPPDRSGL